MMFFFRILHMFAVHPKLGPKLVMIGKMVRCYCVLGFSCHFYHVNVRSEKQCVQFGLSIMVSYIMCRNKWHRLGILLVLLNAATNNNIFEDDTEKSGTYMLYTDCWIMVLSLWIIEVWLLKQRNNILCIFFYFLWRYCQVMMTHFSKIMHRHIVCVKLLNFCILVYPDLSNMKTGLPKKNRTWIQCITAACLPSTDLRCWASKALSGNVFGTSQSWYWSNSWTVSEMIGLSHCTEWSHWTVFVISGICTSIVIR